MVFLNVPANEKLRPLEGGVRIGGLILDPATTTVQAGMIASINSSGNTILANGATACAPSPTTSIIGIFGDDYSEAIGSNALLPSGGSKKVTVWHGFGRYITLVYEDIVATNYAGGDLLYAGTGASAGFLTKTLPVANARPIAVCCMAPLKTTAGSAFNATTNPYLAATEVPEFLKGSMFGARKEDALRLLPDGSRRPFLGFIWLGQ